MTIQNKTVVGYIRVSTEGQATEGVSLEAQRARIEAWALANGYVVAAIHEDAGLSGGRADNRPGLQAAVADACSRKAPLVAYSLSRIARSTVDALEISERLHAAGADLVSLSERIDTTSAAGKMVFRMLAVLAEFERDQVSERTTMALQYKKAQGEKLGGRMPYGRQLAADGIHLEENASEQAVIRVARELHQAGLASRKIAARLAEQGMYSRNGSVFAPSAIIAMVS